MILKSIGSLAILVVGGFPKLSAFEALILFKIVISIALQAVIRSINDVIEAAKVIIR
jgi:hypothetical protein